MNVCPPRWRLKGSTILIFSIHCFKCPRSLYGEYAPKTGAVQIGLKKTNWRLFFKNGRNDFDWISVPYDDYLPNRTATVVSSEAQQKGQIQNASFAETGFTCEAAFIVVRFRPPEEARRATTNSVSMVLQ
jgi:hypothetical protein